MMTFIQGTLLISNILLIFLALVYGLLIIKKHKKEESNIWVYFIIGSGLFFISEILSFIKEFYNVNIGIVKSIVQISFGIIILLAFITKYSGIEPKPRKK
ncbi:hypothetical protein JXB41_05980 [Candidatus Woesearchaeota archaeon]|nr:hypothetical protein [Candidatus Woesearchaeota archaeon]